MWKNALQLEKSYTEPEFRKAFVELVTLRLFLARGLLANKYKPPDLFGKAIHLTLEGKKWMSLIKKTIKDISPSEIKFSLFAKFYHHELFIDLNATNYETIKKLVDSEIIGGRIKYPWVYDRVLYERFFDMFPAKTTSLSYDETEKLLKNTLMGVFQIRELIVGPFGVLNSAWPRFIPPPLAVPLWHCSDPGCQALHPVLLSSGKCKVKEAIEFVESESKKEKGLPSEWMQFFSHIAERPDYYDDMALGQLPWLLANAFSEAELKNILRIIIEQHSKEVRQRFPKTKRFKNILSGQAEKISKELGKAQCLQLILLMSDEIIVKSLEYLIKEGTINIPPTEIRKSGITYEKRSWLNIDCECSQFGLRTFSESRELALARLKRMIKELYKGKKELSQLDFKLRHIDGETVYEKLDRYLHIENPKNVIKDLVFTSSENVQLAFSILRYGWFEIPTTPEEEEYIINKILWKLGFNIGIFPPSQRLFWERLENFLNIVKTHTIYDEHDKELIRSAGVNFFVSLEEILDHSLSFTTWALLSDHYGITKFQCNFDDARCFMASNLNGRRLGSKEMLKLDGGGKNTLYPLIQGFSVLGHLCNEKQKRKSDKFKRPKNKLPGYYGKTEVEQFPFLHTALIFDLRREDYDRIIQFLKETTLILEKSQICNIRNRIEHKRPDFPSQKEIEVACDIVKKTVNKMELNGFCPLVYLYAGRKSDLYDRDVVILNDYRGREISIYEPCQCNLCRIPSVYVPQIIVPWMHVGDSFELMRFQFEETSDYREMWKEYPKRKKRNTSE